MNYLIIVAGGRGERMSLGFNKIFAKFGKMPLIYFVLKAFEESKIIDKIIISASGTDAKKIKELLKKFKFKKVIGIVNSSLSRQDSTFEVLKVFKSKMKSRDLVGVHNAVNPFVARGEIRKVYGSAKRYGGALLAQKAKDTVKISDSDGYVRETPLRRDCWYAQTPQVATFENLYKAHEKAKKDNFVGTDDSQLLERIGVRPKIVPCSNQNFKITFREDLFLARQILKTWVE